MSHKKATRFALSAGLALASLGATVVVGAGTASATTATTVRPNYYQCWTGGTQGICAQVLWETDLLDSSGWPIATLPLGTWVNVECWYPNRMPGSDGYYDHVSWTGKTGPTSGHVDDNLVDFNNQTPREVGLPQCAGS